MRTFLFVITLAWPLALICQAAEPTLVQRVFGKSSAPAHASLPPGSAFSTGAQSKSELVSPRGVYRVGEKAEVETLPAGLAVRRGVTLVASNPGGLRKTIEVRLPGYHFKVKGTAQIAFEPGRSLKVVALEGQVTIALDSLMGEFESLKPGQMLIINPSDHKLPEAVDIDLQRLVATSALTAPEFGALATAGLIASASNGQSLALQRGDLRPTSLLLRGLDNALEVDRARTSPSAPPLRPENFTAEERAVFTGVDTLGNPHVVTREQDYLFSTGSTIADTLGDFTLQQNTQNVSRTQVLNVLLAARLAFPPDGDPVPDREALLNGKITADSGLFSGVGQRVNFKDVESSGLFDRLQVVAPAAISTPAGIALSLEAPHGVDVHGATLTAGGMKLASESLTVTADAGGINITGGSTLSGGSVTFQGGATPAQIRIDRSTVTANHRLRVGSPSSPTGITISNSSQLCSLLANLELLAHRAPIAINSGSSLSAPKGTITVDAFLRPERNKRGILVTDPGIASAEMAHLMAENIRIRGYANGGDALLINGGTFNASQLLKLYAEGASTLRFQGNVSIIARIAYLAGKTVEVDPHGVVTITGKGRVDTDVPHYNGGNYGTITASKGLSRGSFEQRPRF